MKHVQYAQLNGTYSIYVTTPNVHMSVGKETKSKFTTSGAKNSGVPNETLSFSLGLYLEMGEQYYYSIFESSQDQHNQK